MRIQEIGRRLVVGFDGPDVGLEIRFALRDLGAGGVILFTRNYEEPAQLLDLVRRLRELCVHDRLFVSVDQEGGTVQRLRGAFTTWPDMASFAEYGDLEEVRRFARFLAQELAAVDIDWNFAPVCDVHSNPDNPVIGRRAFASDAETVSRYAAAFIEETQRQGVMACAKHFPGHGDTAQDSHLTLPMMDADAPLIEERELAPFRAAARAEAASIMTAHVVYPAYEESLPATLSKKIIGGLARALPYDGLIVTDDLEMAAVASHFDPGEAAVLALNAGCDALLCCKNVGRQEEIVRGVFDAVRADRIEHETLLDGDKRLRRAHARFVNRPRPPLSVIGREEHRDLAERVRAASDARR
ncbi:MAG: beta-N-acetylhexosaminidase [Deltaproteobacteria bacterium]|nr:beta-N-acetylhexosaminidase [Deltaproteobacteria bacterium]